MMSSSPLESSSAAIPGGSPDRLSGPRDLAQLHRDVWAVMRARPMVFALLPALLWLPFDLLSEFVTANDDNLLAQLSMAQKIGNIGNLAVGIFLMTLFPVVLKEMGAGRQPGLGEASSRATSLWGRVLWVSIISGFFGGLALLLFIVPGIYLFVCFSLVAPVAVFEDLRGGDVLKRSRALVQQRGFWAVFGYGVAFYAVYIVLSLAPGMVVSFGLELLEVPEHWALSALTSMPINIVSSALVIGATLVYLDASGHRALSPVGTDLVTNDGRRLPLPSGGLAGLMVATVLSVVVLATLGVVIALEIADDEGEAAVLTVPEAIPAVEHGADGEADSAPSGAAPAAASAD